MKLSIAIRELRQGVPEIVANLEVRLVFRPRYQRAGLAARRGIEKRGAAEVAAWLRHWKEAA